MKMPAFSSGNAPFSFRDKTAGSLICFFTPNCESILWGERAA